MAEVFDYVIVGAGSAGCVLANRLSEDPATRVCLLEAGGRDANPLIKIPLGVIRLMEHPRLTWRFWTTPQDKVADRAIYVPRGKALGGSSSINGMVYMRGHRLDYDDWAAAGCAGWSYAEVLPYFLKSEHNEVHGGSPYHGQGGEMSVVDLDSYNPLVDILCDAARQLQFPVTEDFNGPQQEGFGKRQFTQRNGVRESTATAFLKPARERKNLTVLTGALAERVVVEGGRAAGIEARTGGETRRIGAAREVILSGGSVASPLLLMRSGIGDGEALRQHGIECFHHAPAVGRNLQDHLVSAVQHRSPTTVPYGISWRSLPWLAWSVAQYPLFRKGILANPILHAGGFVKTDPGLDRPDIQFILSPALRNPGGSTGRGHGYGLVVLLLRPESHGFVTLSGPDAAAPPHIDPRFLTEDADLGLMVTGLKLARRLFAAPAFDAVRGDEYLPGAEVASDAQIRDYIRASAATAFHPVGTCRMGADEGAVVDPELRVRGVEGLRVADASIMPTLIGGNTNAPTIMIAEKAADMILGRPPLPAASGL